jgi:3-oxoacyl-(acyl-carrier-protein) synthase
MKRRVVVTGLGVVTSLSCKVDDLWQRLLLVAGADAVTDSGLDFSQEDTFRAGVILGSGIGGLTEIEEQVERLLHKGPDRVSAFTIPKLMLNAAGGNISIRYGIRGPNDAQRGAAKGQPSVRSRSRRLRHERRRRHPGVRRT